MSEPKPHITGSQHLLPYNSLSPDKFEEMCYWLVQREGFERAEHLGAAGSEQGRDIVAWRDGVQWAFQCKRVQNFTRATAEKEISKLLALPASEIPRHYVFIASCLISSTTREQLRKEHDPQLDLYFWAVTELDEKVKKHPDILKEFFQEVLQLLQVPHTIPPPPADFTGRAAELDFLLQSHSDGACISGMHGLGGIGKSALAFVLAENLAPLYPDGQLMLDMLGTGPNPLSPADALRQVIQAWHPTARLPEDERELRNLYLSVLNSKRVILLLDNARGRAQVEPLIPPRSCLLLVTSRWHFALPGLKSCNLEALNKEDAITLVCAIEPRLSHPSPLAPLPSGERGAPAAVLASLCEYLPLALCLSASALAEQPACPIAEFLAQFQDVQTRLGLTGMDASLQISYDLLSPKLQEKLRFLSVFPAPFERPAAAAVWEVDEPTAQPLLDSLVNASLVDWDEAAGFRMHDLVRDFVGGKLSEDECYTASLRHASYYLNVAAQSNVLYEKGGDHVLEGLRLFDRHWEHIRQGQAWAAGKSEMDQIVSHICNEYPNAIYMILSLRLQTEQQFAWLHAALVTARRLGNKKYQGAHLGNLGLASYRLGQVGIAIEYYKEALAIARENDDRYNEGKWLGNLGTASYSLGQMGEAIEFHQQALIIVRETGDRRSEGAILGNLGIAYRRLSQVDKAIDHYQKQLIITQEIGDRRVEGNSLGNLGNAYYSLGQVDKAIDYYQQALAIYRDIGDRRGEAIDLGNLALSYEEQAEMARSVPLAAGSLAIRVEIKMPSQDIKEMEDLLARLREKLGEAAFQSALAQAPEP